MIKTIDIMVDIAKAFVWSVTLLWVAWAGMVEAAYGYDHRSSTDICTAAPTTTTTTTTTGRTMDTACR